MTMALSSERIHIPCKTSPYHSLLLMCSCLQVYQHLVNFHLVQEDTPPILVWNSWKDSRSRHCSGVGFAGSLGRASRRPDSFLIPSRSRMISGAMNTFSVFIVFQNRVNCSYSGASWRSANRAILSVPLLSLGPIASMLALIRPMAARMASSAVLYT